MAERPHLNGPLTWSLLALAVLAAALFLSLPAIVTAALSPSANVEDIDSEFRRLIATHDENRETYQARFDGRSAFFIPRPAPVRRPRPEPRPPRAAAVPVTPSGPPPAPARYTGPSIRALIGETVWFHGGELRLSIGEEGDGVKVLAVNAPWGASLAYSGGEYDVPIFERIPARFFEEPTAASTPGLVPFAYPGESPAGGPVENPDAVTGSDAGEPDAQGEQEGGDDAEGDAAGAAEGVDEELAQFTETQRREIEDRLTGMLAATSPEGLGTAAAVLEKQLAQASENDRAVIAHVLEKVRARHAELLEAGEAGNAGGNSGGGAGETGKGAEPGKGEKTGTGEAGETGAGETRAGGGTAETGSGDNRPKPDNVPSGAPGRS